MPKEQSWEQRLRRQIRGEHGEGWGLRKMGTGTQVTRRWEDGGQSNGQLAIEWSSKNERELGNHVAQVVARVKDGETVSNACKAVAGRGKKAQGLDWPEIVEAFKQASKGLRPTTKRDKFQRVDKAAALITRERLAPRDSTALLEAYAENYFDDCPPGGEGRKRALGDVVAFLRWAVLHRGAPPERWNPPAKEVIENLIGISDTSTTERLTPPVKPDQLAWLLDSVRDSGDESLWLLIALISAYGLRPAEIGAMEVEDGDLKIHPIKRNAQAMKRGKADPPRLVLALELPGRDDGATALELYATGEVKLPKAVHTQITKLQEGQGTFKEIGDAVRQLLDRNEFWQVLKQSNGDISPYSLRHGWSFRAHKLYDRSLSIRDAAALLGHTPAVHHKAYGRWVDEDGLRDAVSRLTATTT